MTASDWRTWHTELDRDTNADPVSGEPDARKRARPVREGAVGFPYYKGAGRLPHAKDDVVRFA